MKKNYANKLLVKTPYVTFLLLILIFSGLFHSANGQATPPYTNLVFSDEFDGTAVDLSKWTLLTGDGTDVGLPPGWGNNELQWYQEDNATVAGGFLTITAREEMVSGYNYSSSRMITENKFDFTYGRIEMRARMPITQGLWPAFWMFFTVPPGETTGEYGGWAASGEIDIMEYIGSIPDEIFGTIHYGQPFPGNVFSSTDFTLSSGTFNDDFHTFAIEWDPGEIRWFIDGVQYATRNNWWSNGGNFPAPFDQDFHLLLNLAVGGNLPGNPDSTSVFPQEYVVDYVRVYANPELPEVAITSPADGANPGPGALSITANASATNGVANVQFLQGDFVLGQDNSAPYELLLSDVTDGPYRIRALVTDNNGNTNYSDFVNIVVGSANQGPYGMMALPVPGTIEAENYNAGGQGIAYNDNDPDINQGSRSSGNIYRNPDGVDLEPTTDVGGGHNVGFIANGEWLNYTVDVQAGTYDIIARVASATNSGSFSLEFDGVDKTGPISFPATGDGQAFVDVVKENVPLDAGVQVMRINMLASGFNINKITFVPADPSSGEKVTFDDMEHGDPFGNGWFAFGGSVGGGGIDPNFTDLPPLNGGAVSLQTGWGSGGTPGFFGGFGRTNPVDISQTTYFNLWINPDAGQDYTLEINLQDDDDGDNAIPGTADGADDEFQYNLNIGAPGPDIHAISGGGWQLVSIPLADFFDDNSFHFGGNGVLDAVPTSSGGNGQLINIIIAVVSNSGADATFRTDFWSFTNGPLGPEIDVDPLSHEFGDIGVGNSGARLFIVKNEGCTDLEVQLPTIGGDNPGDFSILNVEEPFTLGPGAEQSLVVRFEPGELGPRSGILSIASNDVDEPTVDIPLSGNGVEPPDINKVVFDDMEHGDPLNNDYFTFNGLSGVTLGATSIDLPPEGGGAFALETSLSSGGDSGFFGGFGRTFPVDLTDMTHFNFWINPDAGQDYTIEIQLQDDDNGDDLIPFPPEGNDDEFQINFTVNDTGDAISGGGWQLISIPLSTFFDDNSLQNGGNGVLDPIAVLNGGNGQLINVIFGLISNSGADVSFRTDVWCFSEGPLGVSDPDIAVDPMSHNYGQLIPGTSSQQTFEVSNLGGAELNITAVSLTGSEASEFNIISGGAPFTLDIGGSADIVVGFSPTSIGPKSATLEIQSNDPDQGLILIPLSGEGSDTNKIVYDDMEHGDPFGNDWFAFGGAVGGGGIDPNSTDLAPVNGGSFSLQTGWGSGGTPGFLGGFGRNKAVDLSTMTHFNLWINPDPGQDYVLEINLQEDDDGDGVFPFPAPNDDEWQYNLIVGPDGSGADVISGGGWQLVSIPFTDFFDDNSIHGGNGVFDPVPAGSGGNGELLSVVFAVITNSGADATFRTDFWCFSEGAVKAKLLFDDMEHADPFGNGWITFGGSVGGGGIDPNFVDLPPANGGEVSLQTGWGSGGTPGFLGGFGRTYPSHIADMTHFNMWINPDAGQDFLLEINLQEDDDGDNAFPFPAPNDDEFQYNLMVGSPGSGADVISGGGWQLVSIPFTDFFDDNSIHGGNGIFDPVPVGSGGNGQLIGIVLAVITNSGADATFRTDFWCFSEGPLEPDCDPAFSVDAGEDQSTFIGYAPAETETTLTATIDGGQGPYKYFWSNGETTESITVFPQETTTYTVLIIDSQGCTAEDSVTVTVVDVRCGNGNILLCHKNKKTKCIEPEDVPDHLGHGDQLGVCTDPSSKSGDDEDDEDEDDELADDDQETSYLNVYPNPFSDQVYFEFRVENSGFTKLVILNMTGQKVATLFKGKAQEDRVYKIDLTGAELPEGVYIYKFQSRDYSESKKIILER